MSEVEKLMSVEELGALISTELGGKTSGYHVSFDELNIPVDKDDIVETLRFLRDDMRLDFSSFIDLCGVDYPER